MDNSHKKELSARMRDMRIQLIKEMHPVYAAFNFGSYTDEKIAEMYRKLVEEKQSEGSLPESGDQHPGAQ